MKKIFAAVIMVLCFTSAANAESPWVLWEAFFGGVHEWICSNPGPEDWHIINAFPDYDQCIAAKKDEFNKDLSPGKASGTKVDMFESITVKTNMPGGADAWICTIYKCLPAMIDPRK
jgi:hypothetical protein